MQRVDFCEITIQLQTKLLNTLQHKVKSHEAKTITLKKTPYPAITKSNALLFTTIDSVNVKTTSQETNFTRNAQEH